MLEKVYLNLSARQWTCENGHHLDRDDNATKHIPGERLKNNIVRNWRLHGWRLKLDFSRQVQVCETPILFVFSKRSHSNKPQTYES